MLNVLPHELEIVLDILRRHVPERAVWVFGSRVKGSARRASDLDLAVITETPLPFSVTGAMREDFSESDLPFRVDVLDWATTGEPFRRVVEQDKVVVQPGPGDRRG
jgi:type I restriction enzyme S subunit